MNSRTYTWTNLVPVSSTLESHEVGCKSRPVAILLPAGMRPTQNQIRAVRAEVAPPRRRSPLIDVIIAERYNLNPLA
jgi:hypothetical protein